MKMAPPFSSFILYRTAVMGVYIKMPPAFSFCAPKSPRDPCHFFRVPGGIAGYAGVDPGHTCQDTMELLSGREEREERTEGRRS
jgi:hypothetical protein